MTKTQKAKFVRDLTKTITASILEQITSGKVPAEWDGHELRLLLARAYQDSASLSQSRIGTKRLKEFKNHCIIANL